jgi:uncharacterized protein
VDYAPSNRNSASTKIVVAGGFGVGKTTFVGAVSEIDPLRTEALVTNESVGQDDISKVQSKHTTTVAMDFGRITLAENLVLYLFGTPGQRRFWFMTDIMKGDVDAVVYVIDADAVHTHAEAGDAMRALLKDLRVPLVVAVNRCDDPEQAVLLARQLGALASEAVLPCQLIHQESGREVVIEALLAVLDRLERQQHEVVERPEPRIVLVGAA